MLIVFLELYLYLGFEQIWYSRLVSLKKLAKTLAESETSYLENPLAVQLGLNDAVPPSAHRLIPSNSSWLFFFFIMNK